MAQTDYLSVYKQFFLEFAATVNPEDQLPVKVAGYCVCDNELHGEIVDWILQYLSQKRCPSTLIAPLAKIVVAEITEAIKRQPEDCGYRKEDNAYQPLKLMQTVTAKVNDVCLRYLDPEQLASLPEPLPELVTSVCSIKNTRRRMEDRHTVIDDFHSVFGVKDAGQASYYGVFDGHAGTDAAVYGVSHLHQFLAESKFYPSEPERALKDAFLHTDTMFLEKSERDNLRSGTTALCAVLQHDRRMLYVGWLGDSQAVLVRRGVATQLVDPHKPSRNDEKKRIEDMGGCVMYWGMWRVNGQLAVSRAIGDLEYKPYVSADADVVAIPIEDDQDFLILACDGLWDFVSEQQASFCVYETIRERPGDLEAVSASLVRLSKLHGSVDNISVIVAFLTPPDKLASLDVWPSPEPAPDPAMDTTMPENGCLTPLTPEGLPNGTHGQTNGSDLAYQKASFQLELENGKCQPLANTDVDFLDRPPTDGKEDTFDEDDFGPETDVDALDGGADVDDVLMSPTIAAEKAAAAAAAVAESSISPKEQHLAAIEADLELQRQQLSVFDPVREPREETPTPPADDVIGEAGVDAEADNVAESGEESEDEWNYYRVDPSEKKPSEAAAEVAVQPTQPAVDDEEENMESRLNPNAAEFVPSPTALMPSMEEVLSASPFKGKVTPMDDVFVPTASEFQREFHKRPSNMHEFSNPFSAPSPDCPDFGQNIPDFGQNIPDFGQNIPDFGQNIPDFGQKDPLSVPDFEQNVPQEVPDFVGAGENGDVPYCGKGPEFTSQLHSFKHADHLFDKSEVSSTVAEFGDETSTSFATDDLDQKVFCTDLDASMTQSDFLASDLANTLDLSTEMMHSEDGDAKNDPNPFFEEQDNSPVMSPTQVIAAPSFSAPELPSPNIESGIGMDDSPVLASGLEELCLDPAPPVLTAPFSETVFAQATPFAASDPFIEFAPSMPAPQSPVHGVSSGMDFEDFEHQPEVCQGTKPADFVLEPTALVSEPESEAVELQPKAVEPESMTVEPESNAPELLSQTNLEDFLGGVNAPMTNGFGSVEHSAEPDNVTETVAPKAEAPSQVPVEVVTAATAVAAVAAVATTAVVAAKGAKKPTVAEKAKPSPRAAATKAATSPSKPGAPQLSTTPTTRRPLAAASPAARPAARLPAATARPSPKAAAPATKTTTLSPRPKPTATVASARPAPAAKTTTTVPPRPRAALASKTTSAAPTDKKPLTNGEAKPIAKRAEPLAARRPIATVPAKPAARPATAPARATTTTTTTRTTLAAKSAMTTAAKGPVTNGASKPRPATTLGAARAKPAVGAVDKQVKETANKQISQTVGKTSTITRTTTTTTRRVVGATKASAGATTTTTTTKSTGPIRRPAGTAVSKSTTTTTVKTVNSPSIEPTEVEEITSTATTIVKDDSPVLDENNATLVIGTD